MIWVENARFSKNLFGKSIFTGTIIMSPESTDILLFRLENHLLELPETTIPLVLIIVIRSLSERLVKPPEYSIQSKTDKDFL